MIEALHTVTENSYSATVENKDLPAFSSKQGLFADISMLFESFRVYTEEKDITEEEMSFKIDDLAHFTYNTYFAIGRVKQPIEIKIPLHEEKDLEPIDRMEKSLLRQARRIKELETKV